MGDGTATSPATELARQMVDDAAVRADGLAVERVREVAWALKDLCYTAWSNEPARAALAADALRRLCAGADADRLSDADRMETTALAAWTEGIACVTRGRMADAAQCFDAAAAAFNALGQLHEAAQTQVPKIMALAMLGQHAEAAACAESTQRQLVAHRDLRAASKVSLNLGSLHLRRDAYVDAARHYREAAVLFARVGDREHSIMADIGLADAQTASGDFDEAQRVYARARMRANAHGFPVLEAIVDESLALLHLARGEYPAALAGFENARRRYQQLSMPQHLAIAEKQLADAYLDLGLLDEAILLYDDVLVRFRSLAMPDDEAWSLAQSGTALMLARRHDDGTRALERAAALFASQDNATGAASIALARAQVALADRDADTAARLAADAGRAFVEAGLPAHRARAAVVEADALQQRGDVDDAAALYEATLEQALHASLLAVQVRCLTGRGRLAALRGDTSVARAAFEQAVDLAEMQRRALPGDEIRRAFMADRLAPYQELLRLTLAADDASPTHATATAVLCDLDRIQARALFDRIAEGPARDAAPPDDALRARLRLLYRRARRLEEEGTVSDTLACEITAAEHRLLEMERRARLTSPMADADADALPLAALQGHLGAGDALVQYGVADATLFACIVTRDGITVRHRIAAWPSVAAAVRNSAFQMQTFRHGVGHLLPHMPTLVLRATASLRELHRLAWAPLDDLLASKRRIVVVPHAELAAVPFAALHDGASFVGEHREVVVAPSVRLALHGLARTPPEIRHVVAFGETTGLPHAGDEARFVADLFPPGRAMVASAATVEALRHEAPVADVLHMACHGRFRADNPRFSSLRLHDGDLTAEMVERLALPGTQVVLSACESGVSELGAGDERVGLVRAFLVAGASRVLATLWTIDDETTARFMTLFYGALRSGASAAAALRRAQAGIRQERPHPYFWAAFTLHGGW